MKHQSKFSPQEQQHASEQQTQQPAGREFASVEEMLRYDAAQTPVPPAIAQRLEKSIGEAPQPKPAWWERLFGGKNP